MMRHLREDIAELFAEVQRRREVRTQTVIDFPMRYFTRLLPEKFPELQKPQRPIPQYHDWRIIGPHGSTSRDRDLREIHAQLCAELLRR
jgi:hypothetical protein